MSTIQSVDSCCPSRLIGPTLQGESLSNETEPGSLLSPPASLLSLPFLAAVPHFWMMSQSFCYMSQEEQDLLQFKIIL